MANIQLKSVTKSYTDTEVIPPLDLAIDDGEFIVLVGPSGCGKTTTLRMIAGLESVTSGTIQVGERDVTALRPGQRNCAMVFQSYALYPHMTVADNIGFGMKVRGDSKQKVDEAVANAARILNLEEYLPRKPGVLSGGQRQRVAIGRAIVREPDVFLFDEPLSNLDAKLRVEMRIEIKQLHRRLKTTIVYVTHDQVEAMTMADRVAVMNGGVVEQIADPIELYERPRNIFVATFIGAPSMNMLEGRLVERSGSLCFVSDAGADFVVPAERVPELRKSVGTDIVFGIRPEHTGEKGGAGPSVSLDVVDVEPLGPHTLALGTVGRTGFTAQVASSTRAAPEDIIEIGMDLGKAHFFSGSTGLALR